MTRSGTQLDVVVVEAEAVTPLIRRVVLRHRDGEPLPAFSSGSHVIVQMQDGATLRRNSYSLISDPADTSSYAIAIRRDPRGRGGSRFMHEHVRQGTEIAISYPVNMFPLALRARRHLFVAGGIGITPFVAHVAELSRAGGAFELHYSVRTRAEGAFAEALERAHPGRVHVRETAREGRLPLGRLLSGQPLGTHLYVCGPAEMIEAALDTARGMGWPEQNLHAEEFLAPQSGAPYSVDLAASGLTVEVGEHESLLEAIEAAGIDAPYLCRGGACGQCLTEVVACDGEILHHDHFLTPEEKASGRKIMPCVSRFVGRSLVIAR